MFQDFLLKKMLKSQGVPPEQIEMFLVALKKNPELFKIIASEIEVKVRSGIDKQAAAMSVMQSHAIELQGLFGKN